MFRTLRFYPTKYCLIQISGTCYFPHIMRNHCRKYRKGFYKVVHLKNMSTDLTVVILETIVTLNYNCEIHIK